MVVGGTPAIHDVELIDLTSQNRSCRKPDDFPGATIGMVGNYLKDQAIVCGGYISPTYTADCFNYDPETGSWIPTISMVEARFRAGSTMIRDYWWITGGTSISDVIVSSTEILESSNASFVAYKDLPVPRASHNLVTMDPDRVMMLNGFNLVTDTYIFHVDNESWTEGPTLAAPREYGHAGFVIFPNGTKMVATAGGYPIIKSMELLDIDGDQWIFGPDLPYYIFNGASVQLENTFLIVGGDNGTYLDTIWKFDVEEENWIIMDQKLESDREISAAFLVPDDYC